MSEERKSNGYGLDDSDALARLRKTLASRSNGSGVESEQHSSSVSATITQRRDFSDLGEQTYNGAIARKSTRYTEQNNSLKGKNTVEIPRFTPPEQGNKEATPRSVPPEQGNKEAIPHFAPPEQVNKEATPRFVPPEQGNKEAIPHFTPPKKGDSDAIPHFSAPRGENDVRRYSSPDRSSRRVGGNFVSCKYHPQNPATSHCRQCGAPICKDCEELAPLEDGGYLCFDCANLLVQGDLRDAKSKRRTIIIKAIVGIILGTIFGVVLSIPDVRALFNSDDVDLFQFCLILFGILLPYYYRFILLLFKFFWKCIRWKPFEIYNNFLAALWLTFKYMLIMFVLVLVIYIIVLLAAFSLVGVLIIAIVDIVKYIRASVLVKRNESILQDMRDRLEYIRVQSEEGVSAEELARDERMQDNRFAQTVVREGFAGARKTWSDEAKEFAENTEKIKKYVGNEYGEVVRVA